ncbi:MAG: hypothetical protein K8W52_33995 [Deltaproteobacteria bacterium]|nr:hypothetical protein [Deltaproteobacteria bacterium]
MKKPTAKKLSLSTQTIAVLEANRLVDVAGGRIFTEVTCEGICLKQVPTLKTCPIG